MNYSFELLSKNVKASALSSYSTAYLLRAFNSYVEFKGTQGIIEGISAKKSLVNSVITICWIYIYIKKDGGEYLN